MIQKYKEEFKKNTFIFAIGELCTKILQYVVALFLSYFLLKSEIGDITLVKTSANIIIPIISLDIIEAVFRFSADKSENKKVIFSNGILICFIGFLFLIPSIFCFEFIFKGFDYFLIYSFVGTLMLHNIVHYFVKGIGKLKIYSLNSLFYAFGTCLICLLMLFYFKGGIRTYFICYILTHIFCVLFMIFSCSLWKYFSFKFINFKKAREMIAYSLPLILTTIGWWLIGASDTYITKYFLGSEGVGVLSYSHKFPIILTSLFNIFGMSIQLLALSKFDLKISKDKVEAEELFSLALNKSIFILSGFILLITLFVQPTIKYFVHPDFYLSWQFVSLYLFGTFFYLLAILYGYLYNLKKKNLPLLYSTLLCGILNIGLCYFFYEMFSSLYAAALSTVIAYFSIFLYRFFNSKKILNIRLEKKYYLCFVLLLFSCLINSFNIFTIKSFFSINCIMLLFYYAIFKGDIYSFFNAILKKGKKI